MAAPGGRRRAGPPPPPRWLRVGPLLAVLLLAGPPRVGGGAVNRIASPGLAVAAAVAAGLAGGAAGITLDGFRASWARSPKFARSNSVNFNQAALTAFDFDLGLCSMETWENDWEVRPARVAPLSPLPSPPSLPARLAPRSPHLRRALTLPDPRFRPLPCRTAPRITGGRST